MQTYLDKVFVIEIIILLFPLVYKVYKQVRKNEGLKSTAISIFLNVFFIIAWLAISFSMSSWISWIIPFNSHSSYSLQDSAILISQSIWVLLGFILSFSKIATMGTNIGTGFGILISLILSLYGGGVLMFSGLAANPDYNLGIKESMFASFSLITIVFVFAASLMLLFTSFTGAVIGFAIDIIQISNKKKDKKINLKIE